MLDLWYLVSTWWLMIYCGPVIDDSWLIVIKQQQEQRLKIVDLCCASTSYNQYFHPGHGSREDAVNWFVNIVVLHNQHQHPSRIDWLIEVVSDGITNQAKNPGAANPSCTPTMWVDGQRHMAPLVPHFWATYVIQTGSADVGYINHHQPLSPIRSHCLAMFQSLSNMIKHSLAAFLDTWYQS